MLELDGRTLTFEQFRESCLKPNFPAIVRHAVPEREGEEEVGHQSSSFFTSLTRLRSRLAPAGLVHTFGAHHRVPTMETSTDSSADDSDGEYMKCRSRTLAEVMECWSCSDRTLYLKDWHMQSDAEFAARQKRCTEVDIKEKTDRGERILHGDGLYAVPEYLGDDWMDEFCRGPEDDEVTYHRFGDERSDYRFAYIGSPATWTPLHFDVFGTYSWSLNVCGEKLWFFPSPEGNRHLLKNGLYGVALPTDIRTTTGVELWTVLQRPGDLVFVPSEYLHQVHNLSGPRFSLPRTGVPTGSIATGREDGALLAENECVELVIAINHNWCNEWCVEGMVDAFCRDANRIQQLLTVEDRVALFGDDLAAWYEHVERMLVGGTNWNFACIRSFLKHRIRCAGGNAAEGEPLRCLLERCLERIAAVELCVLYPGEK
ncbi:hypothetical protein DQ04_02451100 [Trypanosoma grayi]|uniref:hypothetical protein n=1 Tax=Trypanosoma grayi TaxID=71804 RepID=UPI0004F40AAA|nr:hypothetical protein DQ04_02451100 [Trypanosoma grayi]KEG11608.1 hypothetical protein DQ04_02451100 [Trypanosoma grayi]